MRSQARDGSSSSFPAAELSPRTLRQETVLVLALSLGASAVSALISFVGSVTAPGALADQA
ncbi:MAG: CPBP family intramembrane glutamate endopeptidase, partial [Streptomyces sp.]